MFPKVDVSAGFLSSSQCLDRWSQHEQENRKVAVKGVGQIFAKTLPIKILL